MKALRRGTGVSFSLVLALSATLLPLSTPHVYADEPTAPPATELQLRLEETAKAYNEAVAASEEIESQIDETQSRIQSIASQLPDQEKRSIHAIRAHYKFNNESDRLMGMLFQSKNLTEFITTFDYLSIIQMRNLDQMKRLVKLKTNLEEEEATLMSEKRDADAKKQQAKEALEAAEEARREEQLRVERELAEALPVAQEFIAEAQASAAEAIPSNPLPERVSLETPREQFIDEWGRRIDAYLQGSPLSGKGPVFAAAAWDNGVDPRWSPAISATESSRGAHCFRPHNAWGWGQSSWNSWDEAIYAHVNGLKRIYGYSITPQAAMKYCPPNYVHWYTYTLSQMERI